MSLRFEKISNAILLLINDRTREDAELGDIANISIDRPMLYPQHLDMNKLSARCRV